MRTSSVSERMKPSATLAMNEMILQKRKAGEQVYHLGFGESPFPIHPLIKNALCENADQRSYLPTQGVLALREQVSLFYERIYGLRYTPDQVLIGPGSKALLFNTMMSLKGPLFLPTPCWVSYDEHAHILGKRVHYIKTESSEGYRLTNDNLEQALRNCLSYNGIQKLIVINNR